jgi:hypothetical protein
MFPHPPSSFRRARKPFRRIFLGVLLVLTLPCWKSHDTLGWWRDTHQQTTQDLLTQVDVGAANNRVQQISSHRHHMRWMQNLLNAPIRDTAPLSPVQRKHGGAEKVHDRSAGSQNVGTKETNQGDSGQRIEHVTHLPVPEDVVMRGSRSNTSPAIEQDPVTGSSTVPKTQVDDGESVTLDGSETSGRFMSDGMQLPLQALHSMYSWSERYRFPALPECDEVKDKADTLPDMVVVPFDDAVSDTELEGWEDLWVSKARYMGPRLAEPRIDFVYNCMWFFRVWHVQH